MTQNEIDALLLETQLLRQENRELRDSLFHLRMAIAYQNQHRQRVIDCGYGYEPTR